MKFTIDGKDVKELNYSDIERKKFTTSLNIEYLNEFRNLCNYLDVNLNDSIETLLEMLSEDNDLLAGFIENVEKKRVRRTKRRPVLIAQQVKQKKEAINSSVRQETVNTQETVPVKDNQKVEENSTHFYDMFSNNNNNKKTKNRRRNKNNRHKNKDGV